MLMSLVVFISDRAVFVYCYIPVCKADCPAVMWLHCRPDGSSDRVQKDRLGLLSAFVHYTL